MRDNESLKECGPAHYIAVFQRFWQTKDPCEVADILAHDARVPWSGLPEVAGPDYPELLRRTSTELIPDMAIETISHAHADNEVFIRWRAPGTVNGVFRQWTGVDHVLFSANEVTRIDAIFDTAALSASTGEGVV
jgi:hypothetical protein